MSGWKSRSSTAIILAALLLFPANAATASQVASGSADEMLEQALGTTKREVETLRQQLQALRQEVEAKLHQGEEKNEIQTASEQSLLSLGSKILELGARLATLEEGLSNLKESVDSLAESNRRSSQVGVYGTLTASAFDGGNSIFDAESFEIIISGEPHERLSFFSEIEFERAAAVGGARGGEVVIEQAYATLSFSNLLNLRAGILLVPFGNYNVDHFAPIRDVISRPLVAQLVSPGDWTENGIAFYGQTFLGDFTVTYDTALIAGLGSGITAMGTRGARQPFGEDNNGDKALVGRVAVNRLGTAEVGFSGYTGKYDDDNKRRLNGWAVDGLLLLGPVKITGEFDHLVADRNPEPDADFEGYYVRAVVNFGRGRPRHGDYGKSFPDATFAAVVQYGKVNLKGPLDGEFLTNSESRLTVGLNYRPNHEWVLKLNREFNDADNLHLVRGNNDGWLASIGFVF